MTPALYFLLGAAVDALVSFLVFRQILNQSNHSHAAAVETLQEVIAGQRERLALMRECVVTALIRQFGYGVQTGRISERRKWHFTSSGN